MKPSIAVVICNYNKVAYLKGCLNSLWPAKKTWPAMKVFVVDNASTDGSQDMIRQHYGEWVELIALTENTGGSGGFARGMQAAMASDCEYTALLDNDILLDVDTLSLLVDYLQQHDRVGVAGAKICTMDNPQKLQELGAFIDWEHYGVRTPLKGHDDSDSLPEVVNCDYVPACCLVTRTRIIEDIGTFDEAHFIYWDDMDWCTRVKQAGYEIHAIRKARVRHKMGAVNATNTFSNYYFERNRLRFFAKYLSAEKFNNLIQVRLKELPRQAFLSAKKGQSSQPLSCHLALYDFAMQNWFAQPDNIFTKSPYQWWDGIKTDQVKAIVCANPESFTAVLSSLSEVLGEREVIGWESYLALGKPEECIHLVEHVLEATKVPSGYLVDRFFNVCKASELKHLKQAFEAYSSIFNSIHAPVLAKQLQAGFAELRASFACDTKGRV
ncbi:glycosyltransferase family 2 protein [Alteromonas sp. 14N.309.X.WAT.G.H12]|uniref:glycosyltransferase family 2 protein n=1 Tax=Alteromonas sp. 14N.309.X.WAT.G.H12 TaxID=3120824 RepID=UPI002FD78B3F